MAHPRSRLERDGFLVARSLVAPADCDRLGDAIDVLDRHHRAGERRVLERLDDARRLATSGHLALLVQELLGVGAFALRATLFDKTAEANWRVRWHQDRIIEVAERVSAPGYRCWSIKDGAVHVQPPTAVLRGMLAARIHLDDTPLDNGPLAVIPGSHRHGKLSVERKAQFLSAPAVTLTASRGDVVLMRPLLLHRSGAAEHPRRRRVLHIEYAATDLPGPVEWRTRHPLPDPRGQDTRSPASAADSGPVG